MGNPSEPEQLRNLGNLVEAAIETDSINFIPENMDAISILGSFQLKQETGKIIAQQIKEYLDPGLGEDELEFRKNSLGHLLCFLDDETLDHMFSPYEESNHPKSGPLLAQISHNKSLNFNKLSILGLLYYCKESRVRSTIAKQVLKFYNGDIKNLRVSDVSAMGLFISGLSPSELAQMKPESFEGITPSAVQFFTAEHISKLTVYKLSHMTPEALAMFDESHIPDSYDLNHRQLNELHRLKYFLPKFMFESSSPPYFQDHLLSLLLSLSLSISFSV